MIYKVGAAVAAGTVITDTVTVNATNQSFGANSAIATDIVATAAQADLALSTAASPPTVLAGQQHHVYPNRDEQRSGSGDGRQFHRGDAAQHDVSIRPRAGRMDLHHARRRWHRNCYLHRSDPRRWSDRQHRRRRERSANRRCAHDHRDFHGLLPPPPIPPPPITARRSSPPRGPRAI